MPAQTVNKVMQQRLTRGTPVIVGESFGRAKLRGKNQIVTSKGPVKCNKGGRCAGDWCIGMAVFVAAANSAKKDKKMGWRANTTKICLTHLKDSDGELILPPPLLRQRATPELSSFEGIEISEPESNGSGTGEVSWSDLAEAHRSGDVDQVAVLARRLKARTEELKTRVIDLQGRLLEHVTRG